MSSGDGAGAGAATPEMLCMPHPAFWFDQDVEVSLIVIVASAIVTCSVGFALRWAIRYLLGVDERAKWKATRKPRFRTVSNRTADGASNFKLKIRKARASDGKWMGFKNSVKTLKAKGLRNSRLLLGLRGPQTATVFPGRIPETMLVAVHDEPTLKFLPEEMSAITNTMGSFSAAGEELFRKLHSRMVTVTLDPKASLFEACDPDGSSFFVKRGEICLTVLDHSVDEASEAQAARLHVVNQGEGCGSLLAIVEALVGACGHRGSIAAMAGPIGASVLKLSHATIQELVTGDSEVLLDLISSMVTRHLRVEYPILSDVFGLLRTAEWSCPAKYHAIIPSVTSTGEGATINLLLAKKAAAISVLATLLKCKEDELSSSIVRDLRPHEVLIDAGEHCQDLILLIDGALQGMRQIDEGDGDGTWFGDAAKPGSLHNIPMVLSNEAAPTSLFATVPSTVLIIPGLAITSLLKTSPGLALHLARIFLEGLSPVYRMLSYAIQVVRLQSGHALYEQGEVADSFYLVLNGRLRSVYQQTTSGSRKIVCEYGRFEIVTEPDVILKSKRSTSVHAVRDSVLARVPLSIIHRLHSLSPTVVPRLQRKARPPADRLDVMEGPSIRRHKRVRTKSILGGKFGTIAVVPISDSVPISEFTTYLVEMIRDDSEHSILHLTKEAVVAAIGKDPSQCNAEEYHALLEWITQQEMLHSIVVYEATCDATVWSQRCVRQADCVFVIGLGEAEASLSPIEKRFEGLAMRAQIELVLLHAPSTLSPQGTAKWLNLRSWCNRHYHLRFEADSEDAVIETEDSAANAADIKAGMRRLARRILGTSVGLVLGGGGAKGFSHLGVIKVMQAKQIPIDYIGGVSIGAFVAAAYAQEGGDFEAFEKRCHAMAARMRYLWPQLLDLTYPVVSLVTGRAFNRVIAKSLEEDSQEAGYETLMEDLWLPCFVVTTDVSEMKEQVHINGCLWRYVRASMSLQGYLPPLCDPLTGNLLLDGGYCNNLPIDVMRRVFGPSRIMGVDVEAKDPQDFTNYGDACSGWYVLWNRWQAWSPLKPPTFLKVPTSVELQGRLVYMANSQKLADMLKEENFEYLRPPIDLYGTLQWAAAVEIQEVGEKYGQEALTVIEAAWQATEDESPARFPKSPRAQRGNRLLKPILGRLGPVSPDIFFSESPTFAT